MAIQDNRPSKAVLIVDDEPGIVDLLSMTLGDNGITVLEAYDGKQALDIIRHELPHLVLTDVMMPRLDGVGLCREIRADPATSDTIVILMTAARGRDLSSCQAHQVIPKPFDIYAVAETIKRYLS